MEPAMEEDRMSQSVRVFPVVLVLALLGASPGCSVFGSNERGLIETAKASLKFQTNVVVVTLSDLVNENSPSAVEARADVVVWYSDEGNHENSRVAVLQETYLGDITPSTSLQYTPQFPWDGKKHQWNVCVHAYYDDAERSEVVLYGSAVSDRNIPRIDLERIEGTDCHGP